MDFKSKIDVFYKNFDEDYNVYIIGSKRVEEIGVKDLEDYKAYYEDMVETLKNIVIFINKHIRLYNRKEAEEYSKKAKVLIGKAYGIIENFDKIIKIKREIINNKLNDLDKEKDIINILNKGGSYPDFLSDYIIAKNKMDFTDEIKEKKEHDFKEINDIQKHAREDKTDDELDDIINQVKSGNFWSSKTSKSSKPKTTPVGPSPAPKPGPSPSPTPKPKPTPPNPGPDPEPGWYEPNKAKKNKSNTTPKQKNKGGTVNNTTATPTKKEVKKDFPMSLNDLIANGKLPDNIEESVLLNICHSLGINAPNMDFEINEDLFSRLDNDTDIKLARFNLQIKKKHNERIEEYDRLIKNYDDILHDRKYDNTFSQEYLDNLQESVHRLRKEKQDYENIIGQLKYDDVSSYFRFNIGDPRDALSANASARVTNVQIKNEYIKLDRERIALENATSKKMKSIINTRIRDIEKNIERLRTKECEFSSRQIRIINENSGRYISAVRSKQAKYNESQGKILKESYEVHNIQKEINRFNKDMADIDRDLDAFVPNNFRERRQVRQMRQDRRYLEDQVRRLRSKRGEVDLKAQHYQEAFLKDIPR